MPSLRVVLRTTKTYTFFFNESIIPCSLRVRPCPQGNLLGIPAVVLLQAFPEIIAEANTITSIRELSLECVSINIKMAEHTAVSDIAKTIAYYIGHYYIPISEVDGGYYLRSATC